MKGYKRLTERKNGEAMPLKRPKSNFVATFEEEQRQIDKEILDRLCELEDLIENNALLVMLKGRGNGKVLESIKLLEELAELQEYRQKIEQGRLVALPKKVYEIGYRYGWEINEKEIGEGVFLTKEEAEAELAELLRGEK